MQFKFKKSALALALACGLGNAHAVLERLGPISTAASGGGYPSWYMDTTGIATEFCAPSTASEVSGGWCLLLPADVPTVPETFPAPFFGEHFYHAADANLNLLNGGKALLRLSLEGAFAGAVAPGNQIVFSRVRVKVTNVTTPGTYRFIHPYGVETLTCPQDCRGGNLIFFTRDIGLTPGDFNVALNGDVGPFLLPAVTPGGTEIPPVTAANPTPDTNPAHFGGAFLPTAYPGTGKAYIADPARNGPITGSPLGTNLFRIEGPAGSALGIDPVTGASVDFIETTNFALHSRFYTGTVPGRVLADRASYTINASGQKVDVFATAFETGQPRLPASPRPPVIAPQLVYYDAPCAGGVDPITGAVTPLSAPAGVASTQMLASTGSTLHWGQSAPTVIPPGVCVMDTSARDPAGNVVPLFLNAPVTDEVNVTSALYDHATGTLTVAATSSDASAIPPTLSLRYPGFVAPLVNGTASVPLLLAPPAKVQVVSSGGGIDDYQVKTTFPTVPPTTLPLAVNDAFTFLEDAGPQSLNVLANDSNVAGGTISITGAPRLGTAVFDPVTGNVIYTSNLNAFGADQFTYSVTVGTAPNTQVSNTATVNLTITPVNDPPVAVADNVNAIRGWARNVNVLANDTDPDGVADLLGAVLVTGPAAGTTVSGVTCGATTGLCSFTPTATASTISFTYNAIDRAGALSLTPATVTVTVAAAELVNISRADYLRASSRLRVVGTVTPAMGQTMSLVFVNAAGLQVGPTLSTTIPVDPLGNWVFDQAGVALPAGAVSVRAASHNPDNANSTVRASAIAIK